MRPTAKGLPSEPIKWTASCPCENPEDLQDAGGQAGFVALHQGGPGPGVHQDGPLGSDVVGQPVLAAGEFLVLGQKQGAYLLGGKIFSRIPGGEAVGDEGGEAGGPGLLGSLDLGHPCRPAQDLQADAPRRSRCRR